MSLIAQPHAPDLGRSRDRHRARHRRRPGRHASARRRRRSRAAGVGAVKIGATYTALRAAGLVGADRPRLRARRPEHALGDGCAARCKGGVDFTQTSPRKVTNIAVTGGATARGVGIGASRRAIRQAFPKAVVDHSTEATFGITLYKVPKSGGGRLQFAVDTTTKKVTIDRRSRASRSASDGQPARTGSSAPSLTSVSASSAAGSESRTTPTPA